MEDLAYDFLALVVTVSLLGGVVGVVMALVTFNAIWLLMTVWAGFVFWLLVRK